ncbi:hypothetical protein G9A89_010893 [Geosiphon pyriformis]|nr:hypothetical protein G9A89_010893 [Geosiphon pyriformis]
MADLKANNPLKWEIQSSCYMRDEKEIELEISVNPKRKSESIVHNMLKNAYILFFLCSLLALFANAVPPGKEAKVNSSATEPNQERYIVVFVPDLVNEGSNPAVSATATSSDSKSQKTSIYDEHFAWLAENHNKHVVDILSTIMTTSYDSNRFEQRNTHQKEIASQDIVHQFSIGESFRGYVGEFTPAVAEILQQREEIAYVTADGEVHIALEDLNESEREENAFEGGEQPDREENALEKDEQPEPEENALEGDEQSEKFGTRVQNDAPWNLDRIDQRTLPLDTLYASPVAGGRHVKVYVIDTGINTMSSDFGGRAKWGVTTRINAPSFDDYGHGTHVAGIIAGSKYGVAKLANVIAVKALSNIGSGAWSEVITAMNWVAEQHKVDKRKQTIVNLSLTGRYFIPANMAVKALTEMGIHVVVAAGNYAGANSCYFSPSSAPEAITTGATDITDHIAKFSNGGPCVDVFAPGQNITSDWTTENNVPVKSMSGTSMASPHVAGFIATIISQNGNKSPAEMQKLIKEMATRGVLKNLVDYPKGTTDALLYIESL